MSSFARDAGTIRKKFLDEFAAKRPTVPVEFENVDPGPSPGTKPNVILSFVRLTILLADTRMVAMGRPRLFRNFGLVEVQIFVPVGVGDGLAREIADDISDIFGAASVATGTTPNVNRIAFRATKIPGPGSNHGDYFQLNTSTPFFSDYYKA